MRREDSGMFQCEGINPAGHVTGYTWLRVKSKLVFLEFSNKNKIHNKLGLIH